MHKTVVLNVVGLTANLMGENTPFLSKWASEGHQATIDPVLPAVTCSAQATYLTGEMPASHGIVGNGWYFRDECEVKFWRQSNHLIQSPKIWDRARDRNADFTCANMFWWYNMYSSADYSVTPRPIYRADGLKLPDAYSHPANLRDELQQKLGTFPLFKFWGPATTIESSQWIADASRHVVDKHAPTLTLVYLPHLDYNLQRVGPNHPKIAQDLKEIDTVCEELITKFEAEGIRVIVLSEYGINEVSKPISLNRIFRNEGFIAIREEMGLELLDAGASKVFAVADHQLAHIYVGDPVLTASVKTLVEQVPGVAMVLDQEGQVAYGIDHPRSGELVAVSDPDAWFTYYYWLDDNKAPDFARTVDIHRKPGYDPVELFTNPDFSMPMLQVARRLIRKKLGFRYLMDVIPLDASLVKGSHGHLTADPEESPLLITRHKTSIPEDRIRPTRVHDIMLDHVFS
ncbi:MAG: nucleotide pyrophosphatase/phosphodiesterase family protein [Bacteroidota bacterium]